MASPPDEDPGDPDPHPELSTSTWAGLKWTYGASAVGAMLQLGYTAAMGRLLTPSDFGILALAVVFLRFGGYFAQMGVGPALVQAPVMTDRKISTAFAMNIALSGLVALVFVLAAGLASVLLGEPAVVPVVRVLALGLLLAAAGTTAEALLRRDLNFRRLAINQLASFVIGYLLVGVILAVLGAGVWSLVAAHLAQSTIYSALNVAARPHPVRAGWHGRDAGSLLSFGGRVSVISFAEFIGVSLDTLVIGRFAGSAALGQYNRAFLLVNLPLERLMQGLERVLYPAFSRIQGERERLARVYRSALAMAGALLLPTAAGMAVAAEPLVLVVLGTQWGLAVDVLPFLAVSAALSLISLLGALVCEATADLNRKLVLVVTHVVVLFGLLLAAGSDLRLLAAAVALAQLIRVIGYFAFMHRLLGTTLSEHLIMFLPGLATAGVVAVAGIAWNAVLDGYPSIVLLAIQIASGAAVTLSSLRFGPLSSVRRDLSMWLNRASALDRTPRWILRFGGLSLDGR